MSVLGALEATPSPSITTSLTSLGNACEPDEGSAASDNKKLTSESYKAAMQNMSSHLFVASSLTNSAVNTNQANASAQQLGQQQPAPVSKRQEANFYIQQILTDLISLGVLEYESGFENAINKTYKVNNKCLICLIDHDCNKLMLNSQRVIMCGQED